MTDCSSTFKERRLVPKKNNVVQLCEFTATTVCSWTNKHEEETSRTEFKIQLIARNDDKEKA